MTILRLRKQFTTSLAFNPAGDRLAVGGKVRARDGRNAGRIDLWNLRGEITPTSLPTLSGSPQKLAFASEETLVALVSNRVMSFSGDGFRESQIVKEWDDEESRVVTIAPGASQLVIQTARRLELIDLRPAFCQVWSRPAYANNLNVYGAAAFSPDGRRLAVPWDMTVEIRDVATGESLATLESPFPQKKFLGYDLCWSADGRWIAETTHDWINVWNVESGRHVFHMNPVNRQWIIAAMFHGQTGQMGVATDFALQIFEPESWVEKRSLVSPGHPIHAAVLNATGTVAVGDDHGVAMWNVPW